ncbi:flagellar hook-associated protein FlgK [Salinicola avicenniae]|uniref:flagellar hook-associated protein FlgK n=1 Tax=Salinicola avicenniae TaxID=2916836 RepID=UPI002074A72A|nr:MULTISPECIES: flagellar hook-associated protein FlgK [unclassified Salinicola]
MSLYSIGLSGLRAAQNALSTTSNNITNVYTDGYNRQLTLLSESSTGGSMGSGVNVDAIQRQYNEYISTQLNQAESRQTSLETYQTQINQIDDLLADSDSGLNALMQNFFSSIEDLTGSPADPAARQGVLGSAQSLVAQFRSYDNYLTDMQDGINSQVGDVVTQVNNLSSQVADLNRQITVARARSGEEPNSLLDQRDKLINDMSQLVDVDVTVQDGSTYQVSLGNGLSLVAGNRAYELAAIQDQADPEAVTVGYRDGSNNVLQIDEGVIGGGELGGLLSFRHDTLDGVQNRLGQLAISVGGSFNAIQEQGFDLDGEAGEAFFSLGAPTAKSNDRNRGDVEMAVRFTGDDAVAAGETRSYSGVTADDYRVTFEDGNYQLENLTSGRKETLTLDGDELQFGGVTVTVSGTPEEGDSFLVQPTRNGASGFDVAFTDTSKLAAAGGEYSGSGDNSNALRLLDLQQSNLVGGRATFNAAYASMVSSVGNQTAITQANLATQEGLRDQIYSYQQAESGVNLDEEYANLMRYQQYYSANAKVIEAGTTTLDTILGLRS